MDYSFNAGGGNLISTAADLTAFGQALIEPGFLTAEALALLYSDAWFGASTTQTRMIVATGSNPGVQAALAVDSERHISTAVLANTWGVGSRSAEMVMLARKLTDICAGRS